MNFRSLLTLPILIALFACSEQKQGEPSKGVDLQWKAAPDDSLVAIEGPDNTLRIARRCNADAEVWDCIYVHKVGDGYMARRYHAAGHDTGHDVSEIVDGGGYGCEFDFDIRGTFHEHITNDEGYLDTNLLSLTGFGKDQSPWTRAYVASFMADNKIRADRPYFDCLSLAVTLRETSMEAFGTSKITLSALLD